MDHYARTTLPRVRSLYSTTESDRRHVRSQVIQTVTFDFDSDSSGFEIERGLITDHAEPATYAPVALWLQALYRVLHKLKDTVIDLASRYQRRRSTARKRLLEY